MPRRVVAVLLVAVAVGAMGLAVGADLGIVGPTPGSSTSTAASSPSGIPLDSEPPAFLPTGSTGPLVGLPSGPPSAQLPLYLAPPVPPLRMLDPGLATRGPRPTVDQLAHSYQYGDPPPMVTRAPTANEWRLRHPDRQAVRGYGGAISVTAGSSLDLHLAGHDLWTDLDVFRMGLDDAQLVTQLSHVFIPPASEASPDPGTGLVTEDWPVAVRLPIGSDWASGVYLIKLTGSSGGQGYIPFVVRPEHPGPLTVVIPTMTYEAYNGYGGADLYGWPASTVGRGFMVSYDRPFDEQFGAGLFFRLDFPLVIWLEDHGYSADYVADLDLAEHPDLLQGVRVLVFSGHSEYWTGGLRDAVENAARTGTNLAFFGANQAFWQVRLAADSAGVPGRVVVCYKSAALDPEASAHPDGATVRFEEPPVDRSPETLLGETYGGIVAGLRPLTLGPGLEAFAPDVGLRPGDQLPGLMGEEVDALQPGFRGLALGLTRITVEEHPGDVLSGATLWLSPLGDRVFDAGTFDYAWGLDPRYSAALPGFKADSFAALTERILGWLGALPGG